jgi:hypothetical protein
VESGEVKVLNEEWLEANGFKLDDGAYIIDSNGRCMVYCQCCNRVFKDSELILDAHKNEFCPHCNGRNTFNDVDVGNSYYVMHFLRWFDERERKGF